MSAFDKNRIRAPVTVGGAAATITLGTPDTNFYNVEGVVGSALIPYCIEWGDGYELGGGLALTATTFQRVGVVQSSVPLYGTFSDVPTGATFSIPPIIQGAVATYSADEYANPPSVFGDGATAAGIDAYAGFNATAFGKGAYAPVPGMAVFGKEVTIHWTGVTSSATPLVIHPKDALGVNYPINGDAFEGFLHRVDLEVQSVAFNGSSVPQKARAEKHIFLFHAGGLAGTVTKTTEFTFGSATSSSTVTISGGNLTVTCTGMAATNMTWRMSARITSVVDNWAL